MSYPTRAAAKKKKPAEKMPMPMDKKTDKKMGFMDMMKKKKK